MNASFSNLHLKTSTAVPSKVPGGVLIRTSRGASKTSSSTILDLCPHRTADVGWEGSRNRTEVPVWFTMFKLPWLRHLWWMSKVTRVYQLGAKNLLSLKLVTFRSWNVCFLKVSKDDVASSLCIFAKHCFLGKHLLSKITLPSSCQVQDTMATLYMSSTGGVDWRVPYEVLAPWQPWLVAATREDQKRFMLGKLELNAATRCSLVFICKLNLSMLVFNRPNGKPVCFCWWPCQVFSMTIYSCIWQHLYLQKSRKALARCFCCSGR